MHIIMHPPPHAHNYAHTPTMHIIMHTCMHKHKQTYTHTHICLCTHAHTHTHTHTHTQPSTHTHTYAHVCTHTHTHKTHTHTYAHACTHAHTHTHTHTKPHALTHTQARQHHHHDHPHPSIFSTGTRQWGHGTVLDLILLIDSAFSIACRRSCSYRCLARTSRTWMRWPASLSKSDMHSDPWHHNGQKHQTGAVQNVSLYDCFKQNAT